MAFLYWILDRVDGKKTTIATIAGAVIIYSLGRGWILQDTAELFSTIMVALGLSANVANGMR